MAHEQVLIIEDDPAMLRVLRDNFAFEGYVVRTATDGESGLHAALECPPELVILDIMLPKKNGYEVCRSLREEDLDMPIIMLTAKGQEQDVVLGLNLGADDYVTKPFRMRELLARARAFLRRGQKRDPDAPIRFGPYTLDVAARRLLDRDGEAIPLTPKEYGLLALLAGRPHRAFTRDELLDRVWGRRVFVTGRSVDRCVTTLRGKIEANPGRPVYIRTVREVGYRFEGCPIDSAAPGE